MSDTVIQVRGLSKQYRLGKRQAYKTFRESIIDTLSAPFKGFRKAPLDDTNSFWALKDVNFDIKQGEVVGVIGRNGAGKSTLLKILSRITEPTEGEIDITGRIGSLLEVGTGFHPELTGRENIYLNGAILGMRRAEVKKKFDEIVAFAETEKFLDTPVKHYSSGMYTRLAFAVAAHLEPEILIVDEVLAVGDAEFQKKCLGKMKDVAGHGRTVLFVSHNMAAVRSLCTKGILLKSGRIEAQGDAESIVESYFASGVSESGGVRFEPTSKKVSAASISIIDSNGQSQTQLPLDEPFSIIIDYLVRSAVSGVRVGVSIFDRFGSKVCQSAPSFLLDLQPGSQRATVQVPANFFAPGRFAVSIGIHSPNIEVFDYRDHAISFETIFSRSVESTLVGMDLGSVMTNFQWTLSEALEPISQT